MRKEWRDCIVVLVDLVDVEKFSQQHEASKLMRRFHHLVNEGMFTLLSIDHAYVWNDSALLLSYVDGQKSSFEAVIRDVDRLKRRVDKMRKSYAIAVKGQAFPTIRTCKKGARPSRVTFVKASSWAMANCFKIEEKIKKLRKSWALDNRISEMIKTDGKPSNKIAVQLLPTKKCRTIHVFNGYLWPD
jgi:hypothetical protein